MPFDLTQCSSLFAPAQTNFLSYMKLAEKYGLERAYEKAENCLLHNFSQICEQTDFVDVSKEALCKYLESDKLACLEIDVFRAVKVRACVDVCVCVRANVFCFLEVLLP